MSDNLPHITFGSVDISDYVTDVEHVISLDAAPSSDKSSRIYAALKDNFTLTVGPLVPLPAKIVVSPNGDPVLASLKDGDTLDVEIDGVTATYVYDGGVFRREDNSNAAGDAPLDFGATDA